MLWIIASNKETIPHEITSRYLLPDVINDHNNSENEKFARLMQQKRKAGIDFYAFGNEQSWTLDMDMNKSIHFKASGIDVSFPAVDGEKAMDADLTRYRSLTESVEIIIQLNHVACTGSTFSEGLPFKVHVDYKRFTDTDYTSFDGCGRYTGDYRVHDIWAIIEIEGKELTKEDFNQDMPTMEININTGKVMGTDGCNRFAGSVEVQDKYLIFSQLAGTRMACPKMEMGDKITKILSGNKLGFEIENNKMSLFNNRQEKIMVLKHID